MSDDGGGVVVWWRKHEKLLGLVFVLFLGQLVSFVMALMSFSSSYLADIDVDCPLTQSFFSYLSLTVVFGGIMLYRRQRLLVPWYYYVFLGFVDVQGNYLVNKAYQYSSITSVTLLDCWTIPWVFILTWFFIGTRYSIWQFVGAAICIVGLGLIFLSDADLDDGSGSRPVLGDILVVLGTLFYGFSNVGEEYCCKKTDMVEVVCMFGVFGLLVSICQIAIFERENLEAVTWSTDAIIGFGGYAVSSFLFYTLTPHVLKLSGAAFYNLSLLSSDMWAVLVRIFFYHQSVNWLYYVSFGLVAVGIVLYSKTSKEPIGKTGDEERTYNGEYHAIGEESESQETRNEA